MHSYGVADRVRLGHDREAFGICDQILDRAPGRPNRDTHVHILARVGVRTRHRLSRRELTSAGQRFRLLS